MSTPRIPLHPDLRCLLSLELGGRTPSQLLQHMRSLAASFNIDNATLKYLWLKKLPDDIAVILSISSANTKLEELAEIADGINGYSGNPEPSHSQSNRRRGQFRNFGVPSVGRSNPLRIGERSSLNNLPPRCSSQPPNHHMSRQPNNP